MPSITAPSTSVLSSILSTGALPTIGNSAAASQGPNLAVAGLASGLNWQTIVQELAQAERAPETQWQQQQQTFNTQNSDYSTILTDLNSLQADVQALQNTSLYHGSTVQSSNSAAATGATTAGATLGSFIFNISQLATATQINGTSGVSKAIAPDGNLANVTVGTAGFATPVTAGTFTVDGHQITVAATDSLQTVFDNIAAATNNAVTASYDPTADQITLTSATPGQAITLGSATDTSNFRSVAGLYQNGTDTVHGTAGLGRVQLNAALSETNLNTAVTDGGAGQGAFTINGVTINYNAANDSIQDVLNRINGSAAGVTASYDTLNNRFELANNVTGNVGISMQDVTGNFLAATGLSGGTTANGKNLLYTVNGSNPLQSESNTISPGSSGITGLTVSALQTGITTLSVSTNTDQISTAIQKFVTDYNSVQSFISAQQIVTTSASGTVTAGSLTGDQTANNLVSSLRSSAAGPIAGLSGAVAMLSDLGIQTNSQDNTLSLSDTSTLNSALSNNLGAVEQFFTSANGWGAQMNTYLTNTVGDNGTVPNHQAGLTSQSNAITTQISNLETKITSDSAKWTSEFQAMEQAEAQTTQELTYLSEQVTNGSI